MRKLEMTELRAVEAGEGLENLFAGIKWIQDNVLFINEDQAPTGDVLGSCGHIFHIYRNGLIRVDLFKLFNIAEPIKSIFGFFKVDGIFEYNFKSQAN